MKRLFLIFMLVMPNAANSEGLVLGNIYECAIDSIFFEEECEGDDARWKYSMCPDECVKEIVWPRVIDEQAMPYDKICVPDSETPTQEMLKFIEWYHGVGGKEYHDKLYSYGVYQFKIDIYPCAE